MLITDKTAPGQVLSSRQKVGFMELLRSGCSSACGRAVGVAALVSAVLITTEPLARQSPDDILTILTRQMAGLGGPLILAGAGPGAAAHTTGDLSQGAVEVADAYPPNIPWPPGKPNPFDPGMIARGAVIPIIGEIREPSPEILRNAPPPLASAESAPEPPAGAHYTFAELFGSLVDLFAGDDAPDEVPPAQAAADTDTAAEVPVPEPAATAPFLTGNAKIVLAEPQERPADRPRAAPPATAGTPARHTDSPASEPPAPREAPADPPQAPGRVLAAAEDEPAPPRGEVNYTFSELFGTLADFFFADGGRPLEATRPDAPRIVSETPVEALTDPPPTEAADVILREEDAPRDEGSVDLFAWIADVFSAPQAGEDTSAGEAAPAAMDAPEVAEATPAATLATAGPVDGGSGHALPEMPSVLSEFPEETPAFTASPIAGPPAGEVADVMSRDEGTPRDEPQEITGLFTWIADAFSSAPGAEDTPGATDEAAQATKAPVPVHTGPNLALAELPDSAVSAGSSTTLSEWKDPDREMPASLAELLGAPELARAAENMRAGRPKEKGVIDRLADLLVTGGGDESRAPEDDGWAVKNVETAQIPPPLPKKPRPVRPKKHYLTGVVLKPGGTMSLGKPFKRRNPCIEKKRGSVVFCLEPVQWPRTLEPYFRIDSILYQGARAIVRYDEGIATTYHILFDTRAFGRLVSHFKGRYGPPTESLNRSIAPLAAPRQANPIAMWRSVDPTTSLVSTLEIRKFDDSRGGFPDTKRGAIMLYHTWSEPIFPLLSTLELMLLDPR